MHFIKLVVLFVVFSSVEPFIPYSLTDLRLFLTQTTSSEERISAALTTEASTTVVPTETPSTKTVFEEYSWLDNIVQLLCERGLRLIKLLIQKFIMKQEITLSEFLMNLLVA